MPDKDRSKHCFDLARKNFGGACELLPSAESSALFVLGTGFVAGEVISGSDGCITMLEGFRVLVGSSIMNYTIYKFLTLPPEDVDERAEYPMLSAMRDDLGNFGNIIENVATGVSYVAFGLGYEAFEICGLAGKATDENIVDEYPV